MSDRIGVMRSGKLVQVGTPNEIYSAPKDKFVSEFMGDVNVIPVTMNGGRKITAETFGKTFAVASVPAAFTAGHLVIRPEFIRFVDRPEDADNVLEGKLYNEYALGSRIQYQVRIGENVFIVEKLRQQSPNLQRDQTVLIGWDAKDFNPGDRLMAALHDSGKGLSQGARNALPLILFLAIGFAAPLLAVIAYSFMPARSFGLIHPPTLANYVEIFTSNSYISFTWSLLFAALTVVILALICYPIAYGLSRVFGRWSPILTLLFTIPLFVSENVRLYGWILFFIKNGVLLGTLKSWFGVELDSWLFTRGIVLLGMVYVYLPFMLFPMTLGVSMVPNETREAARDLGASRWQVFREVELPLVHARHHDRPASHLRARGRRHRRSESAGRPDHHSDHPRHRDRLHLCAELAFGRRACRAAHARRRHARAPRAQALRPRCHLGEEVNRGANVPAMRSSGPGRWPSWSSSICRRSASCSPR